MRIIVPFAASVLAFASITASAQTFGPPIQGLCLLSRNGAIAASRAGQSMQAQLKQMQGALSGDLARQRSSIDQQRRTLETRQNSTAPIEYQRQVSALNQQAQSIEQQQNLRFISAQTRGQQQIDQALNAALGRMVTKANCSVVLERDNSYGWNNAMDITPAVTREMDALLQSVALQ
ncbi:OmpH family outer membrane protein [Sphingopyxis sp. JAI108]|uniref:OmpH family outer membrane protein n=1 Tax=Sphingopyxis sp. JAI108 TaxID=2723060 RepID=UPI0015C8B4E5|nr:OmpH family outer membrane protein [Sphingopyxis sp. JAI108]NYF33484.1 Skp family chaperone for outer membrane proteins [Sphingopyxis sp. JAI108]